MLTSEAAASKIFERARKGYDRDEVEALRARVVVALTLSERGISEGLPVGAEDLIEYELDYGRGGYDHRDVDRFIDEAAAVLRRRGISRSTPEAVAEGELDTSSLSKAFGGYATDEVDALVAAVHEAVASWKLGERPVLTADEVERRTFGTKRRGYDHDDVEALIAAAARRLGEFEAANPLPPEDDDEPTD